jgi:DNA-binding beta-propeller fold protein YncE
MLRFSMSSAHAPSRLSHARIAGACVLLMVGSGHVASLGPQTTPPLQRPLDPAGDVILRRDGSVAEGSLPVTILRSPDTSGPDGRGRYLVVVNSGYGVQVRADANEGQQLLQVVDLAAKPAPIVVQEIYFPSPQSANVGAVFARRPRRDGSWMLYVSGGFENRIWRLRFTPGAAMPIAPAHGLEDGPLKADNVDLTPMAPDSASPTYNSGREPIYPTGLAVSSDGKELYVANNLGDTLGIVRGPDGPRPELRTVNLTPPGQRRQFVYPYDVQVVAGEDRRDKVYVSCWNDSAVAVVDARRGRVMTRIEVGAHPNAMAVTADGSRLFVASANADTVSAIDTRADREVLRIAVGLERSALTGSSPQALALSDDERVLFVANAQTQSVAVVSLGADVFPSADRDEDDHDGGGDENSDGADARTRVVGFIPTARYPTALAMVGAELFVGNGKGEAISRPNAPTEGFPANAKLRGAYAPSLFRSSLRRLAIPEPAALGALTTRVLQANGLIGERVDRLFAGPSPIAHVIYVIKENRTYDQVFGDLAASGDGTRADGDPSLALFGAGEAARRPGGPPQDIAPNHRALALRFGLFDRFFVNSEASPDGHNWSTAAFSTDYVDKAFRWSYSGRGRTYDYEGFNRQPSLDGREPPPGLTLPANANELAAFMRRFVPYLNGWRDIAEPDTLYLWDAAARAGLSYRTYGEFVGTVSADDVTALNRGKPKAYPDVSPTVAAVAAKQALEAHHHPHFRAFDMWTPDAITAASYVAARRSSVRIDPLITTDHGDARFRGTSRMGLWLEEFRQYVADLEAGRGDRLPALSILHLPNDHTVGITPGLPTPQFHMADNDYALGRLVEAVSHSAYWKNTAILVVEDDAQDGPDHVDAHRSVALVISAYNRRGALVHDMHNTVSLIRTMELLLGLPPMNQLDAAAVPMTIFQEEPDLEPYVARLPEIAADNLLSPEPKTARERHWVRETAQLALTTPDAANPRVLNEAIWFSVRGDARQMPPPQRFAEFDVMRATIDEERAEAARQPLWMARLAIDRLVRGR